jgi:hypothetical protein
MELIVKTLPNYGIVEGKLPDNIIKDIWQLIEETKESPTDAKGFLAGNISSSLNLNTTSYITDSFKYNVLKVFVDKHIESWGLMNGQVKEQCLDLSAFWVNFQKQTEFNPIHNHSGLYSFVIWMQIPTSFKEQKQLPIASESNSNWCISNVEFFYSDILGGHRTLQYKMENELEGTMILFPASLNHQVYPFYNNDGVRISVSGNISILTGENHNEN